VGDSIKIILNRFGANSAGLGYDTRRTVFNDLMNFRGSIKGEEILDQLSNYHIIQHDPPSSHFLHFVTQQRPFALTKQTNNNSNNFLCTEICGIFLFLWLLNGAAGETDVFRRLE
jgi:hypothetical protein